MGGSLKAAAYQNGLQRPRLKDTIRKTIKG